MIVSVESPIYSNGQTISFFLFIVNTPAIWPAFAFFFYIDVENQSINESFINELLTHGLSLLLINE